ncbi:helix-turn-helix transcriptional regulator [Auritidibacter ignavus]|uniref:AraC family transcriptional regulator n=1 Tax=Auritidibacter ignavus TaxID=678932 RepID=A0AAJ6DBC5_9MICC|nr:AraC family transcriptional regulator [Auritidibacter ignavus]WGH83349.1 AraC family transcriptional regulator [Auritidibacter ignavus]WGH92475.1 AraC family transcriptional regulator [Auritidibacter ignavus]WHS29148.1 AraC family transcriptional regulator [Auritidibacter ignavus]
MRQNLAHSWTCAELASATPLSASRFSQVFVAAFGKAPHAWPTMLRVEKMARLFRDTDDAIHSILRQVGWASRGHAARLFRQIMGMSPSRYRALKRTEQQAF